jgi:dTDP-6-deoxy-L-talose 4-dehydrogenase (NAD+)
MMDGKQFFEMSQGDLIRDFVKVEIVANHILSLALSSSANGIYNIGSGEPCSVLEFADRLVRKYDSQLVLKPDRVPARDDEPKAFWADMKRFNSEFQ